MFTLLDNDVDQRIKQLESIWNNDKLQNKAFQTIWNNIISDVETLGIGDFILMPELNVIGYADKNCFKHFQEDNVFLENNFNAFFKFVSDLLNIPDNAKRHEGVFIYGQFNIRYFFEVSETSKRLSLRFNSKKISLPILNNNQSFTLQKIGFTKLQEELILNALKSNSGIIVSGVTGSGKTTTMNLLINVLSQIKPHIKACFNVSDFYNSTELGTILRSDVEAIALGDIRDFSTLNDFIKLRESGHQVISTIHANDVLSSLHRLESLNSHSNKQIYHGVDLLINQSLVKNLCPHCSIPINKVPEIINECEEAYNFNYYNSKQIVRLKLKEIYPNLNLDSVKVRNHLGCIHCSPAEPVKSYNSLDNVFYDDANQKTEYIKQLRPNSQTGYCGLTICASVLPVDPRMKEILNKEEGSELYTDADLYTYWKYMSDNDPLSDNMIGKDVKEHAIYKMFKGEIDPHDILDKFETLTISSLN